MRHSRSWAVVFSPKSHAGTGLAAWAGELGLFCSAETPKRAKLGAVYLDDVAVYLDNCGLGPLFVILRQGCELEMDVKEMDVKKFPRHKLKSLKYVDAREGYPS